MLIITAVVLWSYYAYVFALCLCKYETFVLFVPGPLFFCDCVAADTRTLPADSRVDKITLVCIEQELAK